MLKVFRILKPTLYLEVMVSPFYFKGDKDIPVSGFACDGKFSFISSIICIAFDADAYFSTKMGKVLKELDKNRKLVVELRKKLYCMNLDTLLTS